MGRDYCTDGFFQVVAGHRLEPLYRLALGLGLRRGEILALRWADINLETHTLRIQEGKSEASRRVIPIPDVIIPYLREHWNQQQLERQRLGLEWHEHGLVFPSEIGTPLEGRNLVRHFKRVLQCAGLPETIRFHDLRHSCASLLVAQGVHLRVVMQIMGHSQIGITANTYSHVADSTTRAAMETLDDILRAL